MLIVAPSLIIVAKGPETIAGSILNFMKMKGKPVEIRTAATMLRNIDNPTIKPKIGSCQPKRAATESSPPQTNAKAHATLNSLRKYDLKGRCGSIAKLLTTRVSDWVPTASLK